MRATPTRRKGGREEESEGVRGGRHEDAGRAVSKEENGTMNAPGGKGGRAFTSSVESLRVLSFLLEGKPRFLRSFRPHLGKKGRGGTRARTGEGVCMY
jgi:hypothetical protein